MENRTEPHEKPQISEWIKKLTHTHNQYTRIMYEKQLEKVIKEQNNNLLNKENL